MTKTFGSFLNVQAALFRDALLAPSKGEGPRKGGLNKARILSSPHLASRGQRVPLNAVETPLTKGVHQPEMV